MNGRISFTIPALKPATLSVTVRRSALYRRQTAYIRDIVPAFTNHGWQDGQYEWSYREDSTPSVWFDEEDGMMIDAETSPRERSGRVTRLLFAPIYLRCLASNAWSSGKGYSIGMRHSTITPTLDIYGHLNEGAEAAAIQANADMTAVPMMLAATGTHGLA